MGIRQLIMQAVYPLTFEASLSLFTKDLLEERVRVVMVREMFPNQFEVMVLKFTEKF
jgi:hypothetical protein